MLFFYGQLIKLVILINGFAKKTDAVIGRKSGGERMPYSSKAFGVVISRLRSEKGMSQENLSAFAGIARSHLTMLENGRKTARIDTVFRIADALGIKPSELISMVEDEAQHKGRP